MWFIRTDKHLWQINVRLKCFMHFTCYQAFICYHYILYSLIFSCQFKHVVHTLYAVLWLIEMCRHISVGVKQKGSESLYMWQSVLFTLTSLSPLAFVKRSDSMKTRPSWIIEERGRHTQPLFHYLRAVKERILSKHWTGITQSCAGLC